MRKVKPIYNPVLELVRDDAIREAIKDFQDGNMHFVLLSKADRKRIKKEIQSLD